MSKHSQPWPVFFDFNGHTRLRRPRGVKQTVSNVSPRAERVWISAGRLQDDTCYQTLHPPFSTPANAPQIEYISAQQLMEF